MPSIIRNWTIVEDDWRRLADDEALPAQGRCIVSLERWRRERDLLGRRGGIGLAIPSDLEVGELADALPQLELIALSFVFIQPRPEGGRTFDGRAYTQARLLRERFGFKGEIRATGDVFRDAMFYMHRCGVSAFELPPGQDLEDAARAARDFSLGYQGAADDPTPIFRRRDAA